MKIMQVMFSRGNGGLERVFADHAVLLAQRGHTVHCVILDRAAYTTELIRLAAESNGTIVLHICDTRSWRRLTFSIALYRLIAQTAPEVIVTHGAKVTSRLSTLRLPKMPLVGVTHNQSPRLMRATHLIALTQELRQLFVARGFAPSRIQEIPNPLPGCTAKEASPRTADHSAILKIGTLSRLVPKKGIDIFLRGFRIALDRGLKAQAIIGGDGHERPALEKLCRLLNLETHVSFKGWVSEQCSFYAEIDWLCVPSRCEPFGLVALESFRYGVPVLAARVGGLKEIIRDGGNGLLFDGACPHALADSLMQLASANQQMMAQKFRENAYTSLQLYKPELIAAKIESALLQAIVDMQSVNQTVKIPQSGQPV